MALFFDQEDALQLVGFHVGSKLLGADILTVREILREPVIDTMPDTPSFVKGVVKLRGAILPVVYLNRIIGIPQSAPADRLWVLVAQAGEKSVGFIVDDVTPIIRTTKDAVYQAPDLIISGLRSKYINGVCETERGLLVVVDLNHVLLEEEVRAIGRVGSGLREK